MGTPYVSHDWHIGISYKVLMASVTLEGILDHVFIANQDPDPILVRLYYGQEAPPSAFRRIRLDRVALRKANGSHVIVPIHDKMLVLKQIVG